MWGWTYPGHWNRAQLIDQYARKVYAIIALIAENEAKISLEAFKENEAGDDLPVPKHEFLKLLRKPNSMFSQFQFLEWHFTFMKVMGESFWYIARGQRYGKPMELHLLRPDLIEVAVNDDEVGTIKGYVLNKPDGTKVPFEPNEILHFKLPNLKDPYRGLGPVQAGKVYIETEEFASKWTRNAILNSGRPSGIVRIKGTISAPEFERVKRQWRQEQTGLENAGKTLFVKGADEVDFTKLGMELQEIALDSLKSMSQDDLLFMFRMNKAIMGITDDVNKATSHEARVFLNENIIKPDWDRFIDHINAFILPDYGINQFVKYKKPSLKSDAERLEEDKTLVDTVKTRNEIREERGLEPLEGGDFLYVPLNMVAVGSTLNPKKSLKKKV